MKKYIDGKYVDMTAEEITELSQAETPYKERIIARIRTKYTVDDELAILRQKDAKPEEFDEYNAFVEQIKLEEKGRANK